MCFGYWLEKEHLVSLTLAHIEIVCVVFQPSLIQGSVNDACSLSTQEFLNNAPEYRTHFNNEQQKIEDFNSQYMKRTKALRRRVNHLSKISNSRNDEFIQEPYAIFRGIPGDDNGYMSYFWAYSAIPAPDVSFAIF